MHTISETLARVIASSEPELRVISERSGVPLSTLAKIKYRQTASPRVDTVQKLAEYFESCPQQA